MECLLVCTLFNSNKIGSIRSFSDDVGSKVRSSARTYTQSLRSASVPAQAAREIDDAKSRSINRPVKGQLHKQQLGTKARATGEARFGASLKLGAVQQEPSPKQVFTTGSRHLIPPSRGRPSDPAAARRIRSGPANPALWRSERSTRSCAAGSSTPLD